MTDVNWGSLASVPQRTPKDGNVFNSQQNPIAAMLKKVSPPG